jgi:hypothetical protein
MLTPQNGGPYGGRRHRERRGVLTAGHNLEYQGYLILPRGG